MEQNLVQAVSIMEAKLPTQYLHEFRPDLPIIAVETIGLSPSAFWSNSVENHRGDYEQLVKKIAGRYFSSVSPTTISEIMACLDDIATGSIDVFSMIVSLWKFQNCRSFKDEDGRGYFSILSCGYNAAQTIAPTESRVNGNQIGDWNISNSVWKREVLSHLSTIYITPETAQVFYELIGYFHSLEREGNGHDRLISYVNADLRLEGVDEDINTYEKFKTRLENDQTVISAAFNKFPFMDEILKELGLEAPGEAFNFTRDLACEKLNIVKDHDGLLDYMAYMLGVFPESDDLVHESEYLEYSIVASKDIDGSYFELYSDDSKAARSFRFLDRIFVDIPSVVNAFRGSTYPLNIAFKIKRLTDLSYKDFVMSPWSYVNGIAVNNDSGTSMINNNYWHDTLDMPTDLVTLVALEIDSSGTWALAVDIAPRPTSGDFFISTNDIESVISDACYDLVVNPVKLLSFISGQAVMNTLGNNGNNSDFGRSNNNNNKNRNKKKKKKTDKPKEEEDK